METNRKTLVLAIILVATIFTWYYMSVSIIQDIFAFISVTEIQQIQILCLNIGAFIFSLLMGIYIVDKTNKRVLYLYAWTVFGFVSSLLLVIIQVSEISSLAFFSIIFGFFIGLGMPAVMGFFGSSTHFYNRGAAGGIAFAIVIFSWSFPMFAQIKDISLFGVTLAMLTFIDLLFFMGFKINEDMLPKSNSTTFGTILKAKSFVLYYVTWFILLFANMLTSSLSNEILNRITGLTTYLTLMENITILATVLIIGFLAKNFGRKSLAMFGVTTLVLSYAFVGLFQSQVAAIFVYILAHGIAWGTFYTIFIFTVWGDIALNNRSSKFYALAILPLIMLNSLSLILQPFLAIIFSNQIVLIVIILIFLAMLFLIYAPETLPEKVLKDRELKSYIEKAQKKAAQEKKL